jgi:hypothetical protein
MKRLILVILAVAAGYYSYTTQKNSVTSPDQSAQSAAATPHTGATNDALMRAIDAQQSNVQVQASGVVDKILSDDNEGSRHQRFIVRLPSGKTILIAHNIDLAPRVAPLSVGDQIEFSGEYEWNNKGGVVHWTHRDPSRRHAAGWLRHGGETFQ